MHKEISLVEQKYMAKSSNLRCPEIGDVVSLSVQIREGQKERIQKIQGLVISTNNCGIRKSFTIRSFLQIGGIERIYSLHAPCLKGIEVVKQSKIRRSKLYYLRTRSGKATRLQSKN
uniref:Ribosomal protein L19 n=2 Tax=Pavlovaceae TaxID=418969 RepID=M1K577_DIALT|nr:ribosomal protein L19 [Diacronema lutheri]YP_009863782.1 ribosomal protein L19 [Pavlova sp. NIVA-4/92]AGE93759.1 ribosomal protein L19 [Diacronema lutheri]QKE31113.1 ribosomal protein L19 [Pavlova sp. NIVA-4/92]|mmetsp:Transcript_10827/g.34188  ORF Transcript_10827/g.34188 Transcript_10827/m.34188 type:complete len:117 (-) Transcript_10827:38-388(-)